MSILKRLATQLLGLRWGFETTSNLTMYPFGSHFVYDHLEHSFMSGVGVFFLRQDEHPGASNWQRVALT